MPRSLPAAAAVAATRRLLCTTIADATPSPAHLLALPPVAPSPTADELARLLLAHHNPFHPSESPLQLLSGGGVSLSQDLLVQILLRLRGASKLALSLLNAARLHPSVSSPPNADAYDAVVDALGRAHQFDAAWRLVVEAAADGAATPRTFAVLARRYVAAGMTRQAVRAFDDMEAFVGREPDAGEFTTLLDTLCKYKYPKVAAEVFNKRKYKYEPNEKMYTILIYGWCKVNRNDMSQKFLKDMIDHGIEPNIVTYNILLNGICRHASLHPDNRFDRTVHAAENLLKEMHDRGIEPDVTSYSIILHVYSRAHKAELCLCMFRSMKDRGICPTVATYTSVIKCLASCGRLEDAERLLHEMASEGVCPSPATYNCFFKEYRGRKDITGALELYNKMKAPGSPTTPDIHSYNILLGMFIKLNRHGTVMELWNDMCESTVGPDLDSYTLLIHGLCDKEKWREACQFFMEMIEKGFLPQKITFETLYRGLIQADMLRTWRRLKKRVDEEAAKFGDEYKLYHIKPYKR
ncbi:pentatricopeptide repeat-containing protein At2g13420, mitochondrial [Lolium perenne]|uniref:pentatricopeptide repeat-containing protein At2g13420, mitochondrial n=1 Tax=Lolium perenne TaxID=4522 RepID=UPI0021F5478F|nr:pentatricopeptide repeat-containing protein At2g13420, mitochondrial-like [Lolium perenne]